METCQHPRLFSTHYNGVCSPGENILFLGRMSTILGYFGITESTVSGAIVANTQMNDIAVIIIPTEKIL